MYSYDAVRTHSVVTLNFVFRYTSKFLEFLMTLLDFVPAPDTPGGSQIQN